MLALGVDHVQQFCRGTGVTVGFDVGIDGLQVVNRALKRLRFARRCTGFLRKRRNYALRIRYRSFVARLGLLYFG